MTVADSPTGPADKGGGRDIVTPEGVPLHFELARHSERLTAIVIDLTIILGVLIGLGIVAVLASTGDFFTGWGQAILLLAFFFLRNFYFTFFELRWHGTTPGKRVAGLRVIDRHGGRLRPESVFARNLMREIELFLPLSLLFGGASGGWMTLLALVWASIFTLMPLFNRDNMRVGDIVGGTWVIRTPKSQLLPDMATRKAQGIPATPGADAPEYAFTREQLEIYGILELQTLETVLRQTGVHAAHTRAEVCRKIRRKIGWESDGPVSAERFLKAFYKALRAHLESKMLFGERRESKHDRKK